jgi:hypothetical protein
VARTSLLAAAIVEGFGPRLWLEVPKRRSIIAG